MQNEKRKTENGSGAPRKAGRPKKRERPVTPEILEELGRLHLMGKTTTEISKLICVTRQAVEYHLEQTVKPLWRNRIQWESSIQVAKAEMLYKLALEAYERSLADCDAARALLKKAAKKGPKATKDDVSRALSALDVRPDVACLSIAARMLDFVAKVKGGYAPKRIAVHEDTGLRVAGLDRGRFLTMISEKAVEIVMEREKQQAVIAAAERAARGGRN